MAGIVAAGISDWADGYFARQMKTSSVLGSYLDPLADKVRGPSPPDRAAAVLLPQFHRDWPAPSLMACMAVRVLTRACTPPPRAPTGPHGVGVRRAHCEGDSPAVAGAPSDTLLLPSGDFASAESPAQVTASSQPPAHARAASVLRGSVAGIRSDDTVTSLTAVLSCFLLCLISLIRWGS